MQGIKEGVAGIATELPGLPQFAGLRLRACRGVEDLPALYAANMASSSADGIESGSTLQDFTHYYSHLVHCDLQRDLLVAEVEGRVIGYARTEWAQEAATGTYLYNHFGCLVPEHRRRGIGTAMLRIIEERIRRVSEEHGHSGARFFQDFANHKQTGTIALLEAQGYTVRSRSVQMLRPDAAHVPDLPLPEGIEIRPAHREHWRALIDAHFEAFREHPGFREPTEEDIQRWVSSRFWQPEMWIVAWDGDRIAGSILSFIDQEENEKYGRLRGYTEDISVVKEYRRRGLARAMLARAIRRLHAAGMTETTLFVHTQNPTGAYRLYEGMGYAVIDETIIYHKPLA